MRRREHKRSAQTDDVSEDCQERQVTVERFNRAEEDYFLLQRELEAGHLTPEEFEAALRKLIVEDTQGRYWRLGGDGGKWYRYDGHTWIEADPYAAEPEAGEQTGRRLRRIAFAGAAALVPVGLGLVLFALSQILSVGAAGNPPVVPTAVVIAKASPAATRVAGSLADGHAAPNAGERVPVASPTPVSLPSPTQLPTSAATLETATPVPSSTPDSGRSTALVPLPSGAAGVYVTQLFVVPAQPKRNRPVAFVAVFLNYTNEPQAVNWLIQVYDRDMQKRFGNSRPMSIIVPAGLSQFTSYGDWHVAGPGGCIYLFAQAQYQGDDTSRVAFPSPDGGVVSVPFTVCP